MSPQGSAQAARDEFWRTRKRTCGHETADLRLEAGIRCAECDKPVVVRRGAPPP
jgi:hypothetical protein